MENPLRDQHDDIPFDRIRPEHVVPATVACIDEARRQIDAIAAQAGPLTYDSVLGALERARKPLQDAFGVVELLESVATSPALRAAYGEAQPQVSAFWSDLALHEGLFDVLTRYAATDDARALDPVRRRHLRKELDDLEQSGARLPPEGKARLRALDVELSAKTTRFSQNVLDATNAHELVVDDEARLAGLPDTARRAARASAEAKGLAGFRFTLHAPSYVPAITYLDDRALREALWRAYNTRASSGEHDNRGLLREILRLRRDKARLLGRASFADLTTHDRMAKTGARARAFVGELRDRTRPWFERDRDELRAFARDELGLPELAAWDVAWASEKLRRARHDYDQEALRPYFPVPRVLDGVFTVLRRLYGVSFVWDASVPTWHPEVTAYRLLDDRDGARLATVYVDLHPRESKNGGAWMTPLRPGCLPAEPHVAVVAANFTPPLGGTPALLTHDEVETLFHELGHLVHACLSTVPVRLLAGTEVAWDFVELPSQIMQNWTWEREVLDLFARHHDSGETIPEELFQRMVRARRFRAASVQMQQLGYAELDLALHCDFDPDGPADPVELARSVLAEHVTAPLPEGFSMVTGFGHLFSNPVGYAAGYYSYKWAEVLDADAFGRFREEGLLSRDAGMAFRAAILERGNSADPEELFRAFRGRDPRADALFERQGLVGAAR
jgi:oligopeptidase A